MLASFLASLVEFVEALTIVLAVGVTRGWRSAVTGALLATTLLIVLVLAFGPSLQIIPIRSLQLLVGILLLLFGISWLRKAILRAAGVLSPHDEAKIFAHQTATLQSSHTFQDKIIDRAGLVTSFNAVLIEGLEVVFIVIAVGATGNMLLPASNRDLHMLEATRGAQFPMVIVRTQFPEAEASAPTIYVDLTVQFAGQTAHYKHAPFQRVAHGNEVRITGTIPATCSDFKIVRPSFLDVPIENTIPVSVDMTWRQM